GPRGERDRDLADPLGRQGELVADLEVEVEARALEPQRLEERRPNQLVVGRDVGVPRAEEDVRHPGERPHRPVVRGVVVVALAAEHARSVDDVEVLTQRLREQPRVVRRIVLEIGVLGDREVPAAERDRGSDGRPLAEVPRLQDDAHVGRGERRQQVPRAVGGAVVHDDQLALPPGPQLDRLHAAHDLEDGVALVVDADDDRQLHRGVGDDTPNAPRYQRSVPASPCASVNRGAHPSAACARLAERYWSWISLTAAFSTTGSSSGWSDRAMIVATTSRTVRGASAPTLNAAPRWRPSRIASARAR